MDTITTGDGTTIAYDDQGEGDPLVLLHGITESSVAWDPLVAPLAERHRVVRVDLRGHGASTAGDSQALDRLAADVAAVVDALGIARPAVLGHSLGGFVGTVLAAARPVRAVVNVDQPLALAAFKVALAPIEPMLRADSFEAVIGGMFAEYTAALPDDERARLTALRTPDQAVVLGIWDPVLTQSVEELDALVRELVGGIDVPYLAIHGEDPGDEYRAWLAGVVPTAHVEVWPDSGHYPHLAHPDRFVARVEDLLATV
jgi:pimeloyl-ACP methyl ester carboxylesterase